MPAPADGGRNGRKRRPTRRDVRRGEGEVRDWPRGLVGYRPSSPDHGPPRGEEDRTANRLILAGRLIRLIESRGEDASALRDELADAHRRLAAGDRERAEPALEALLGKIVRRADGNAPPR